MATDSWYRVIAFIAVLGALVVAPVPLLPPQWLSEAAQATFKLSWPAAYLLAVVALHSVFYGSLGVLGALVIYRAATSRGRLLQLLFLPLAIAGLSLAIRSIKLGHLPLPANAAIPLVACFLGTALGLGLLYRRWKTALAVTMGVAILALWVLFGVTSTELTRDTQTRLRRLVVRGPELPMGEARFGKLLQAAFAPGSTRSRATPIQENRAAILALGIALGHERLARYVGLSQQHELIQQAIALREGTILRGREDWPRHYLVSAALTVLENPLVSDAGGVIKEQLDALTRGSGFSFGDLTADRAGVRFALAATRDEAKARAMQELLQRGYSVGDFFPIGADLPENLTVEQFREKFGSVGSARYRSMLNEIESRLDHCRALAP